MNFMGKIYLVSLGCEKNRVDGELLVGELRQRGFIVTNSPDEACVIIINTCGFIKDAVQESIDMVLELVEYKESGSCKAIFVMGCMAQRYFDEVKRDMPEVDAVFGVGENKKILEAIALLVEPEELPENCKHARLAARVDDAMPHIAYVKIAEGCDNNCTYCTIPMIRGKYISRPMEEILDECSTLIDSGVKEIILIAQDTALYGVDLYGEKRLPELIGELDKLEGLLWLRIMYIYPEHITPKLITALSKSQKFCRYLDMPIQHCDEGILKLMGRNIGKYELSNLVRVLRDRVPGIALRTTVMVGFPGETEVEFKDLLQFIKEMKFDRLGVFPYSQEEGTAAAVLPKQKREQTKKNRYNRIMRKQQAIHFAKQKAKIGTSEYVIIDGKEGEFYVGRTHADALDVDALVYIDSDKPLEQGSIVLVKITGQYGDGYDLRARA